MIIKDIKGKSNYIRFILADDTCVKGDGELMVNGFVVYKDSLKLMKDDDTELKELTLDEAETFANDVREFLKDKRFKVTFE